MLVYLGMEREKIEALKAGDFFVDSVIVSMKRKERVIMIVTESGSVFTVHIKSRTTCNVFKKNPRWTPGTKRWKQRTGIQGAEDREQEIENKE